MKKIVFSILVGIFTLFSTTSSVFAECTGWIDSPDVKTTEYTKDSRVSLESEYATATRGNAYASFKYFNYLPQGFSSDTSRKVYVYLMEYDFTGSDDEVHYYTGTYSSASGRQISSIIKDESWSGNTEIEEHGDHISELYIKTKLQSKSGDSKTNAGSQFDYMMCQK